MVTLFLRQGETGKQVLLSFPATTPAEKADVTATMEQLKSMSKTVTIQGAASEVMNLGLYLSGVDLAAEGEVERINQLAERLERMSEVDCDKFAGMLDANSITGTRDILQLTERLDDYVILPGCGSAHSIGKYLMDCGAFPVPEKLIGYINYEAVGIEFCDAHGGAVCSRGYVVRKEGLPKAVLDDLYVQTQQEACLELITLYLRTETEKKHKLTLPTNDSKLAAIQVQLDAVRIDRVQYFAPYFAELIPENGKPSIEDYNELAKAFARMDTENGELLKYASVLSVEKPETMQDALRLALDLDNYERISGNLYDYGVKLLQEQFDLNDECIYELEGYMDFTRYGQDQAERAGFVQTEFGRVRSLDQRFEQKHSDEMTLGGNL